MAAKVKKRTKSRYGMDFLSDWNDLKIELFFIQHGGTITKDGQTAGLGLFDHLMNARKLIWPERYRHRWTDLLYREFVENDVIVMMGAACVAGHTRILNPITGEQPTIESLCRDKIVPVVMTLDGPKQAGVPFVKGKADLFEITLSDGNKFTATEEHRVLTSHGYVSVRQLSCGDMIAAYSPGLLASSSGNDLSVREPSASSQISLATTQVVSIRKSHYDTYYDITVPGPEHYFAEGAIHHNSSQKTSHAVEFCLINYWARPENTLVILSTVNMDKLDIGVFAELKMLWRSGKDHFPWLAGNLLEHKRAITTDNIDDGKGRDFRRGVIARPCYMGGRWVGLGILAGTKQDYIFYVADELQFMEEAFAASWPHLFVNGKVKIIGAGNPKHDPEDQLAIAGEPVDGWNSHPEPEETAVWDTKFMGGRCVNLVGTDSPNFDVADGDEEPFPRLIGRAFEKRMAHDYGPDSFQYYQLVKGVMKISFAHSRVITRQLCREHHALEKAEWLNTTRQRIYALDPTYGGDDRCVGMCIEWGEGKDGKIIIRPFPYRVFPIKLSVDKEAEDQIADILAEELATYGIPPQDCFYDSTGKGTLGGPFALKFGHRTPTAVDSGGSCTKRPVRQDLFVDELDPNTGEQRKRLKRCDEHYSKFVSEMWYSVRYVIEAGQMRELREDVMAEGCARIYEVVAGNKIQVEPKTDPKKKEDLKRRLGKSPDLFDCLAIGVEGTRQRGFVIERLGKDVEATTKHEPSWYDQEAKEYEDAIKSAMLTHA